MICGFSRANGDHLHQDKRWTARRGAERRGDLPLRTCPRVLSLLADSRWCQSVTVLFTADGGVSSHNSKDRTFKDEISQQKKTREETWPKRAMSQDKHKEKRVPLVLPSSSVSAGRWKAKKRRDDTELCGKMSL